MNRPKTASIGPEMTEASAPPGIAVARSSPASGPARAADLLRHSPWPTSTNAGYTARIRALLAHANRASHLPKKGMAA